MGGWEGGGGGGWVNTCLVRSVGASTIGLQYISKVM